jgi:hypothetical protein
LTDDPTSSEFGPITPEDRNFCRTSGERLNEISQVMAGLQHQMVNIAAAMGIVTFLTGGEGSARAIDDEFLGGAVQDGTNTRPGARLGEEVEQSARRGRTTGLWVGRGIVLGGLFAPTLAGLNQSYGQLQREQAFLHAARAAEGCGR